jgi:acetoin:2,6-dichlorophenolindophenol oxidoreductase subunit alpha
MTYSKEQLVDFYTKMLRIRLCEESFIEPILSKEIRCPVHLCTGQEAVAVGVCSALDKDDYIFGNHRSHGHYLAKGGGMRKLVAEVFCRETGCSRGRGGSMHLLDLSVGMMGSAPIVAGTIALAMGAALAAKIRNDGRVAVSFFGDGATGEGVLCESLNFAALKKLPIVFVCENNLYSTHLPIGEIRVSRKIYELGIPFGEMSHQLDGNDVLEVHRAARKAVDLCRKGKGPVFLECLTYRMHGHVGPDDNIQGTHTDIRPPKEIEKWRKKDPIIKLERHILKNKFASRKELKEIHAQAEKEVLDANSFARNSSFPREEELSLYVYKN